MNLICTYKFNKEKKYVVACSFGPDSMALLNYLYEQKLNLVVAHVNYHKRDVSNKEESDLKEYCNERNIPFEVLDTTGLSVEGNFQDWARNIRYDFFTKIAEKYWAEAVVVAHQEDDVIETYLMQKKRGIYTKNAGIAEKIYRGPLLIIRPFLKNTKQDLLNYDKENNVPFSIDVSNLTNSYKRNEIRHKIVEKMTIDERKEILLQVEEKNKELEKIREITRSLDSCIEYSVFKELSIENVYDWIIFQLDMEGVYRPVSVKFVKEMMDGMSHNEHINYHLNKKYGICKCYGKVRFYDIKEAKRIILKKPSAFENEYIKIDFTNGAEDRNIQLDDYPLTIKIADLDDEYKVANYYKKVRRLYIDWKMPLYLRKMWIGVYSKDGKLIYLPRYREKYEDNHKSIFKIKFK